MFIVTTKFTKRKLIAIVLIVAIIIAAIIIAIPNRSEVRLDDQQSARTTVSLKGIKTNEDRIRYIESLGYTVDSTPLTMQEVTIPKEFNDTYTKYNEIQLSAGFDLGKYQGKRVMLYTYAVTNYESAQNVMLDLLIYKNKIIGGGVYTASSDGFMYGLVEKQ